MRFLTRWLSQRSNHNDQTKPLSDGPDFEPIGNSRSIPSAITMEAAQVLESISVEAIPVPVPSSESQRLKPPAELVAPPAQPLAKTQAVIDAELVNSDAWWDDVEKGKVEWASQLFQLQEKVSTLQREGNAVFLMALSAYFDLPSLDHKSVLDESVFAQLQKKIEGLFDLREFQKIIDEKTRTRWNSYPRSVDYYMGEFVMQRSRYIQGANRFIGLIADNFSIVESHIEELSQAERDHNPQLGGLKLSAWRGFTRQFAKLHLIGIAPSDFFPEPTPRYLRDYRAEEMGVAGARFLWALMGAVRILSRPSAQNTSQIGIEFEKKLIEEISAAYPTARIEPTPATGDQGADVVLLVDGIKIVIQAKKYTGVVGNAAVQEVFAAKEYYEADYAMVVTNSRYTQSARTLAGKIGVELSAAQDYLRRIQQLLV
ncbi:restriction endonuclease [Acidovorax soli]|uniref:Restriction endonuclease n=1 Tax=Acidovorax soli TaxID=592050 RepID=A0A1H3Y8V6_9BURK|nr:restriction endonuclease [Acidovorax soli]SEA08107.1 Restriction endonuclease [Acidovorax soli]